MIIQKALVLMQLCLISLPFLNNSHAQNFTIQTEPLSINIYIPYNKAKDVTTYGLQFNSIKNITGIKAHFSDLEPEDKGNLRIARNALSINPLTFNTTAGQLTDVDILLNLPKNTTGTYHGTVTFLYPGGVLRKVPITVTIQPTGLNIELSEFNIHIPYNKAKDVTTYGLQFNSIKNITGIKAHFSDLEPEDKGNLRIARNALSINPLTFNTTAGQLTDVDILLNLPKNTTGTYHGTVTFSYPGGQLVRPLNIFLRPSDPFVLAIGLTFVALGVFIAFIVKLFKLQFQARDRDFRGRLQSAIGTTKS